MTGPLAARDRLLVEHGRPCRWDRARRRWRADCGSSRAAVALGDDRLGRARAPAAARSRPARRSRRGRRRRPQASAARPPAAATAGVLKWQAAARGDLRGAGERARRPAPWRERTALVMAVVAHRRRAAEVVLGPRQGHATVLVGGDADLADEVAAWSRRPATAREGAPGRPAQRADVVAGARRCGPATARWLVQATVAAPSRARRGDEAADAGRGGDALDLADGAVGRDRHDIHAAVVRPGHDPAAVGVRGRRPARSKRPGRGRSASRTRRRRCGGRSRSRRRRLRWTLAVALL